MDSAERVATSDYLDHFSRIEADPGKLVLEGEQRVLGQRNPDWTRLGSVDSSTFERDRWTTARADCRVQAQRNDV